MRTYLVNRLLLSIITLAGMSVIIFTLMRVVPGDIIDILAAASGYTTDAERARIAEDLGLDRPLLTQYLSWMGGLFSGELGYSYVTAQPVASEIGPRLPITLKLASLAMIIAVLVGVPLGVVSAVKKDTALDYLIRTASLACLSMPSFWLALIVLMFFGRYFGFIPIYIDAPESGLEELLFLLLPATVAGLRSSALLVRLTRSSMLDVLGQDYIRTARSKGVSDTSVNFVHSLGNAAIPVLTVIGVEFGFMIGNMVIIETVFNIPGIAGFVIESVSWRDYPIVQNLVMFMALAVVVVNLTVDLLYAVLDPRIRVSK